LHSSQKVTASTKFPAFLQNQQLSNDEKELNEALQMLEDSEKLIQNQTKDLQKVVKKRTQFLTDLINEYEKMLIDEINTVT
jgi:ABC-type uncharacterized transport system ATPase subunit